MEWYYHILIIGCISVGFNLLESWKRGKFVKLTDTFGLTLFSAMVWGIIYNVWVIK